MTIPDDIDARNRATIALMALYEGANLRACDVPQVAWAHLLPVLKTPRSSRPADVQARMDALAESITKETE